MCTFPRSDGSFWSIDPALLKRAHFLEYARDGIREDSRAPEDIFASILPIVAKIRNDPRQRVDLRRVFCARFPAVSLSLSQSVTCRLGREKTTSVSGVKRNPCAYAVFRRSARGVTNAGPARVVPPLKKRNAREKKRKREKDETRRVVLTTAMVSQKR